MENLVGMKKSYLKLQTLQLWKVQKKSTILQHKTYALLMLTTMKTKIENGGKGWTDDKMF